MKKQEEQKHFLSLMARIGDYIFIDISKLDIANGYNPTTLSDIDSFTMHFSTYEIINSIKRANLAIDRYINGSLVIEDNQKHNPIKVIDKDFYNGFRIDLYLSEKMKNKMEINNILNKFRSICKDKVIEDSFIMAIKNNNLDLAVDILFNLPYLTLRKFIVYLIENRNKELEIQKIKDSKNHLESLAQNIIGR